MRCLCSHSAGGPAQLILTVWQVSILQTIREQHTHAAKAEHVYLIYEHQRDLQAETKVELVCHSKAIILESLFWWSNNVTLQVSATKLADLPH